MDRLICGDVGYGKTEIALRAAFKAVQEGKQVVYLVPTTILAQQHYNTFVQRMKDFPVRVDLMSGFRTPAEQKQTLEDLKKGMVDIVIGTHRVLSKDVEFKRPGPSDYRRGAALRRGPQGKDQAAEGKRGRPDADGHADSADAAHEPGRDPGHERSGGAAGGPGADPDLCDGVQ